MELLNPWMLMGFAGLAIPIAVHLLSRRRFDVVDWGAMQFLRPSPKQRQSIWLDHWWLLLLRLLAVAAVVLAMCRPWLGADWLTGFLPAAPRDVVLIMDGSYSLSRPTADGTVQDQLLMLAQQTLAQLGSQDNVQILEAREQPRRLLPTFSRQRAEWQQALWSWPEGTADSSLLPSLRDATDLLLETTRLERDIVILTDGQARAWSVDDAPEWARWQSAAQEAAIQPRVWVLTTATPPVLPQVSVGPLTLSSERLIPGGKLRVSASLTAHDAPQPLSREIQLRWNGRPSAEPPRSVIVPVEGTATVDWEVPVDAVGSHVVSVELLNDPWTADDRSEAAVDVVAGLDVLVVDGSPDGSRPADPDAAAAAAAGSRRGDAAAAENPATTTNAAAVTTSLPGVSAGSSTAETMFLQAALAPTGSASWLRPRFVSVRDLRAEDLVDMPLVLMANVSSLPDALVVTLDEQVRAGQTVIVTCGDQMVPLARDRLAAGQAPAANGTTAPPSAPATAGSATPAPNTAGSSASSPPPPPSPPPASNTSSAMTDPSQVETELDQLIDADRKPITWPRWLPVTLHAPVGSAAREAPATTIDDASLTANWLKRFRRSQRSRLCETGVRCYWRVSGPDLPVAASAADSETPPSGGQVPAADMASSSSNSTASPLGNPAIGDGTSVLVRLSNGDPLLLQSRRGLGSIWVLTSTLDADWNDWPTTPDYVAWWYELLQVAAETRQQRTVLVGQPLISNRSWPASALPALLGPRQQSFTPRVVQRGPSTRWNWPAAAEPGVYLFLPTPFVNAPGSATSDWPLAERQDPRLALPHPQRDAFVVRTGRDESNVTPLTVADRERLSKQYSITFLDRPDQLPQQWRTEAAKVELSLFLLYGFLAMLMLEAWWTRRLIRRQTAGASPSPAA
jgi:hypothetical protein